MIENCLEIKGVSKSFPGFKLNNINLSLPKGYIMGLVGANGAGKTTTIQLILNMLEKDSGEIFVFGYDFEGDRTPYLLNAIQAGAESMAFFFAPVGNGYI